MVEQTTDHVSAERQAMADLMVTLGPDAPTLCEGWTTADLAAHLVVREGSILSAAGIMVPAFASRTRAAMDKLLRTHGFLGVIGLLRTGPAGLSPWRIPAFNQAGNLLEFFVHHEDVRRAQPDWDTRELSTEFENMLWSRIRGASRLLFRRSAVGVLLARSSDGATVRACNGEPVAVVEGRPSELMLYSFGRKHVAEVDLRGPETATETIRHTRLGL